MTTKISLVGLLGIFLAAIAVLVIAPTSQLFADENSSNVTVFIEHEIGASFLDLGAPGSSPGDRLMFDNPLFDENNVEEVARTIGDCVQVGPSPVVFLCTGAFTLDDGQIEWHGYFDVSTVEGVVGIVGGTGAYTKARGEILVERIGPQLVKLTMILD